MSTSIAPEHVSSLPELPEKATHMARGYLRKAETDERAVIGRAIVRARSLLGWSLKEFAGKVGRDERQLSRWEKGDDRDRAQLHALWAVEELRGPLLIALAEAMDDSGVVVTTQVSFRHRKAS